MNDTASSGKGGVSNSLPEIEVKVFDKTILLNMYCEKRKGVLTTLLEEVEKHDLIVVNCSMIPFETFALHVTLLAQMDQGFNEDMEELINAFRSVLITRSSE